MISSYQILFLTIMIIPVKSMAQELQIPLHEGVQVDGNSSDWDNVHEYIFISDSNSIWTVNGNFSESDLSGRVKIAWNNNGLYFLIDWNDDMVDTKFIPKDSSIIQSPSGRRMDAMYLYDNLKLQIRKGELNYSCWLSPTTNVLQWHQLRVKKEKVDIPPPTVISHVNGDSNITIEIKINWDHLSISPEETDQFNLLILISDTDIPGAAIQERMDSPRKFVSLASETVLTK